MENMSLTQLYQSRAATTIRTHVVAGTTNLISRARFEEQLLGELAGASIHPPLRIAWIDAILKGDQFNAFWVKQMDNYHLAEEQVDFYVPAATPSAPSALSAASAASAPSAPPAPPASPAPTAAPPAPPTAPPAPPTAPPAPPAAAPQAPPAPPAPRGILRRPNQPSRHLRAHFGPVVGVEVREIPRRRRRRR